MGALQVTALNDTLASGVRIEGLTMDLLQRAVVHEQINRLFQKHGLLVFTGVEPSSDIHLALSLVFGPLKEHPSASTPRVDAQRLPGVIDMAYRPGSGGQVKLAGRPLAQWLPWHFDHCYNDELNRGGVLRALQVPPGGGETGFVDGVELYKRLPMTLRRAIEGERILYSLDVDLDKLRFGRPAQLVETVRKPGAAQVAEDARRMPRAMHPAVWVRPSGEKVLHVSPWMALGIAGRENVEGDALLESVCRHTNDAAQSCSYFHRWQLDDMLVWDNWRYLHAVSGSDPAHPRHMQRTTIQGDYGLGCFEHDHSGDALEMTV
ncbi:TauD/TfdA family dioxygenase [Mangrovimicrobium sediminis]|uniref:TauD/TfdA family dioxygenase n=1 Tax=Mangrovimicrobium sediminis TaxID=2562682 RepID=A0A4Z0LUG9_9GAMM|nr:TauD/TfdA family dioxygenase [Haliea sp. SAOS-164]TGD71063.1 TauD/TfdA family dioxygenase [Haliea sp. SAOS-164]